MISLSLVGNIAFLVSFAAAAPFASEVGLVPRQEQMPPTCSDYCSVPAGCVCITRPTNCVANYTVKVDETCGSIVDRFQNFTATDLYKWNPEIGQSCFGLRSYVPVCIGVTGYKYNGPIKGGDTATPADIPVPLMSNITSQCTKYGYIDAHGSPTLPNLRKANGISLQQWNAWNMPCRDKNQEWAAWAGYWNCVAAPDHLLDTPC